MHKRFRPDVASAIAVLLVLAVTACGDDQRSDVATNESATQQDRDTSTSSTTSIPDVAQSIDDDSVADLDYNVLTSPKEFDAVLGSLAPKPTGGRLASVCTAYYELFAGYRILEQFSSSTKDAEAARGLAKARVQTASDQLRSIAAAEVDEAARNDPKLAEHGSELADLHDRLETAANRSDEDLSATTAAADDAAQESLASVLLDLPVDEREALDQLGESENGCTERR